MQRQHIENLFRRIKGELVSIKTVSGGVYEGRVIEVTNDYVCVNEIGDAEGSQVFLFFTALESMVVNGSGT
jgi:vacuolar-type H+-ATPase subunit B/Vma2